ncbi:MAG TPA: MBL fold metallo-hydrolase [Candidatus Nitrosotalea sp.]|nr:MBL fold metallo-hydrolase [Candidatus Nitrosotalea sp.]
MSNAAAPGPPPAGGSPGWRLEPVERVEIVILVDNVHDNLLTSDAVADRPRSSLSDPAFLRAEHGYSLLVTVGGEGYRESFLYDAGLAPDTALHNLDVLGLGLSGLRALVLSHGHADHHGGLVGMISRVGRTHLPVLLHPDAWLERKFVLPDGREYPAPPPSRMDLDREGVDLIEERGPTLLLDRRVLVTGQVPRVSDFEPGLPGQYRRRGRSWEPDFMVWDDQGLIVNVAGRGLVVMSACSHAGVVNVLLNAKKLTGVDRILAFVGGCHLSGAVMAPVIGRSVDALAQLEIEHLVAGHCTGWRAAQQLANRMPQSYLPSSVGTTLRFSAKEPS